MCNNHNILGLSFHFTITLRFTYQCDNKGRKVFLLHHLYHSHCLIYGNNMLIIIGDEAGLYVYFHIYNDHNTFNSPHEKA